MFGDGAENVQSCTRLPSSATKLQDGILILGISSNVVKFKNRRTERKRRLTTGRSTPSRTIVQRHGIQNVTELQERIYYSKRKRNTNAKQAVTRLRIK